MFHQKNHRVDPCPNLGILVATQKLHNIAFITFVFTANHVRGPAPLRRSNCAHHSLHKCSWPSRCSTSIEALFQLVAASNRAGVDAVDVGPVSAGISRPQEFRAQAAASATVHTPLAHLSGRNDVRNLGGLAAVSLSRTQLKPRIN